MTGKEFLHAAACHYAWHEAHQDGTNGMLAVLFVIKNVMAHTKKDLRETLEGLWARATTPKVPDVRDPSFQYILDTVDGVFDGTVVDRLTNGATAMARGWPDLPSQVAKVGGLQLWGS